MKVLITGATSGIGQAIAEKLDSKNCSLILVGSRSNYPEISKYKDATYLSADLTTADGVNKVLSATENLDIDVFIDNAGFGDIGSFKDTSNEKEIQMIDLNCKAAHILLKEFLKRFVSVNKGSILVTASIAAYSPAGYMATYYATKAYIQHLALGYRQELKDMKSSVSISILCPGPVATNFEKTGNVAFKTKKMTKERVAKVALKGLKKKKALIIPGFQMKFVAFVSHLFPLTFITRIFSRMARKRQK